MILPTAPPYIEGADLPDLTLTWKDENDAVINFSTGWTFVLKVGQPGSAALFTKSTGIVGAATAPNVTIAWATTGELNTLSPGTYQAHLIATRTADSKNRYLPFVLPVKDPIT